MMHVSKDMCIRKNAKLAGVALYQ